MKMVRHGTSTPSQMLRRCHDVSSSSSIVIIVIKREPNTSYALMENAQGTTVKSINSLFEFLADCSHEEATKQAHHGLGLWPLIPLSATHLLKGATPQIDISLLNSL